MAARTAETVARTEAAQMVVHTASAHTAEAVVDTVRTAEAAVAPRTVVRTAETVVDIVHTAEAAVASRVDRS